MKAAIKKVLISIGLLHPGGGVKISAEEKARFLLQHKNGSDILIETGTHKGNMIAAVKNHFREIHSIELDRDLHQKAKERFFGDSRIHLYEGDSAEVLGGVLADLRKRALFWLDAHQSGRISAKNAPTMRELETIFAHPVKDHRILIDDARHFDRKTIRQIKTVAGKNGFTFSIERGIFLLAQK